MSRGEDRSEDSRSLWWTSVMGRLRTARVGRKGRFGRQ